MGTNRRYLLKILLFLCIVGGLCFWLFVSTATEEEGNGAPLTAGANDRAFVRGRGALFDAHLSRFRNGEKDKNADEHNEGNAETEEEENEEDDEAETVFLENPVNVAMIFTKAQDNAVLKRKFTLSFSSMHKQSTRPIHLHLIGDKSSLIIAKNIISVEIRNRTLPQVKVSTYDADIVASKTDSIVGDMRKHFIYKPGAYYADSLFFYSISMHKIFNLERVILLDIDLKFLGDVADLHEHFDQFASKNLIGIAREQQPVYRHVFHMYRKDHPNTRIGEPPPDGITGFNSAVLLLDLQRMRNSVEYAKLLNASLITELVTKYKFQGHLGDQDFFSLVSNDNPQLFYILPCGWNRQLCQWWRGHGYKDVFDLYYRCDEDIFILHGNCNTQITD